MDSEAILEMNYSNVTSVVPRIDSVVLLLPFVVDGCFMPFQ